MGYGLTEGGATGRHTIEVDVRWSTSGDTSVKELECAGTRDAKWFIDCANVFIDAGTHMIRIESEGIAYQESDHVGAVPVKPTSRKSSRHIHIFTASAITYVALQVPADCVTSSVPMLSTTPKPACTILPWYFPSALSLVEGPCRPLKAHA
ncbi:uncharacterized protein TRAVEDRAFT_51994 [Trametes versicolor FP-101664 SS1]|uniref:uncharacterized protein n=1 Tax=Trametes versicolor (strain FP-101664) TaxID=717944 RepID=UPI0004621F03|nr:uncharacterized protein TRAVEDRAFT_51994 [Trametes versicolor FP-101664 SS1]EIW54283.1 hypothetical protein TRAVEDRAFT_51994 [Trametes versicolor FP-101664 SS1]